MSELTESLTREEIEAAKARMLNPRGGRWIRGLFHGNDTYLREDALTLAALALRQMDEIERLLVEYRKVYDWGEVLDKDRHTLTADLAAARAAIERLKAQHESAVLSLRMFRDEACTVLACIKSSLAAISQWSEPRRFAEKAREVADEFHLRCRRDLDALRGEGASNA